MKVKELVYGLKIELEAALEKILAGEK